MAAGADYLYAERFGVFEAAGANKAYAFGHFMDQNEMAPDAVVTSAVANWGPDIKYIIDEYWKVATTGAGLQRTDGSSLVHIPRRRRRFGPVPQL